MVIIKNKREGFWAKRKDIMEVVFELGLTQTTTQLHSFQMLVK